VSLAVKRKYVLTELRIETPAIHDGEASAVVVESLRARFHRGVLWSVAAAVATSGSNFVLNIIVARLLGREKFGEFGMVLSTIVTVAGIAQLAMGYTATKYVAEFRSSDRVRAGRVIGVCSFVSILTASIASIALYVFAPSLAEHSLKAPQLSGALQAASVIVFFTVLTGYQMGVLAGLENYRSLAALATASGVTNLVAAAACAKAFGLEGAIFGLGAASAIQWMMFRRAMHTKCKEHGIVIQIRELNRERFILLSFALPAALGGLSSMPALWLGNAFLVRQVNGFSQMALYTAAFSLRSFVFFLPSLVNRVTMSLLNNQRGLRNWDAYGRVFKVNLISATGAVVIGAVIVAMLGVPILQIFGKSFQNGFPVLLVLLYAALVESITGCLYQVVQAESRMWSSIFIIMLPRDLLIVLLSYVLSPRFGAVGLGAAYATGWTVACLATGLFVARIGIRRQWPTEVVASGSV
jgi:O-antigen/teichoic acid export membrane protein